MSRRRRIAAIVAGIVLIVAAALSLYRVAAARPEPMRPEDFGRDVRLVASLARETALLADLARRDRVTGHFARTHRQKLEKEVEAQADKLKAPVPVSLAEAGEQARSLTARLADNLRNLESHLPEPKFLAQARDDAARLADQLAKLEPPK
jgi:hypothetical protein